MNHFVSTPNSSRNSSHLIFQTPRGDLNMEDQSEENEGEGTERNKRKPTESPSKEEDNISDFLATLNMMFDCIGKLGKHIGETKNTKTEIKLNIEKITNCVSEIRERDFLSLINETQSEIKTLSTKKQQPMCHRCHEHLKKEEEDINITKVRNMIETLKEGKGNFTIVKDLLKVEWPDDLYIKSSVKVGNPLVPNQLPDTVLFLKSRESKSGIIDTAKVIHPSLEEVLNNDLKAGETSYLENISKTKKGTECRKRLYLIAGEEVEEMVESLKELINELLKTGSKEIAVAVIEEDRRQEIRKLVELATIITDIKVEFYVPNTQIDKTKKFERQPRDTEVLIIKPSSTSNISYADMTKTMKEAVNPKEIGVNIKNVKKYKDDSLMITTNRGEAEKLKAEILASHGAHLTVNIPKDDRTLMVIGIDALAEEDDIEEGIMKALGVEDNTNITIKSLKQARNGTLMSEIVVSSEYSIKLIQIKRIKIGWTLCSVEKKMHIPRCYNCLRMGHIAKNCASEKSGENKCFNCMETGHSFETCTNSSVCPQCNKSGHRPDTMACPQFRSRRNQGTKRFQP